MTDKVMTKNELGAKLSYGVMVFMCLLYANFVPRIDEKIKAEAEIDAYNEGRLRFTRERPR